MMDGVFDCTLTAYNDAGGVARQFAFDGAEITGFSENAQGSQVYVSISFNAKAVTFDGRTVTANNEVFQTVRGR
jgi:hypothetical protein